jgi:hypothetical protein
MRPTKHPESSPVFEQIVRARLQESKHAVSQTKERLTQIKKTVQKARELVQRSQGLMRG